MSQLLTWRSQLPLPPVTGEIRRVNRIEQRINEAAKLGFTKVYAPKNSLTGIKVPKEITVIGVTTIGEVLQKVFN